jgi:hypothetical protein
VSCVDDVFKAEMLVQWDSQKCKICLTTVTFKGCELCFTALKPLPLLSLCVLSFRFVGLKMYCVHNFALKSGNRIFMWYVGKCLNTCCNSS